MSTLNNAEINAITSHVDRILKGENRQNFLQCLGEKPQDLVEWVAGNLFEWGAYAAIATGGDFVSNCLDEDAADLVEHFQSHFKNEIPVTK